MSHGPYSKTFPEREAAKLVAQGVLRLDPDGSVWRLKKVYGGQAFATTPKRIDYGPPGGHRSFKITVGPSKRSSVIVARFVWQMHFGDIPQGQTVNHKNGKADDDRPDNYELMTQSEQHKHRFEVLGHEAPAGVHKRLSKQLAEAARVALETGNLDGLRTALEAYDARPFGRMAKYREAKLARKPV